jgi:hypothetical protein
LRNVPGKKPLKQRGDILFPDENDILYRGDIGNNLPCIIGG